jgi:hypothetical protein
MKLRHYAYVATMINELSTSKNPPKRRWDAMEKNRICIIQFIIAKYYMAIRETTCGEKGHWLKWVFKV